MLHDKDYYEVQGEGVERDDPMDEGYAFKPVAECPVCNEPSEVNLIGVAGNAPMCEVCVYNTLDKELKAINANNQCNAKMREYNCEPDMDWCSHLNIAAKIRQCNEVMRKYNCEPDMDWCSHCQRVTGHYEDGVQGCSWCSICNR